MSVDVMDNKYGGFVKLMNKILMLMDEFVVLFYTSTFLICYILSFAPR